MEHLTAGDVAGIALSWVGAATIVYLTKDALVAIVCVIAAYHLTKHIILKEE